MSASIETVSSDNTRAVIGDNRKDAIKSLVASAGDTIASYVPLLANAIRVSNSFYQRVSAILMFIAEQGGTLTMTVTVPGKGKDQPSSKEVSALLTMDILKLMDVADARDRKSNGSGPAYSAASRFVEDKLQCE